MSKVLVVSAKPGANANDRKILNEITQADAPTAAPTLHGDGDFLNRIEFVHIMFKLTNSTADACTFYIQLHWWSPITEVWHKGERLKVNSDDIQTLEVQGLNRLYLQVDQVVYAGVGTPTLDAWIGMVVPV